MSANSYVDTHSRQTTYFKSKRSPIVMTNPYRPPAPDSDPNAARRDPNKRSRLVLLGRVLLGAGSLMPLVGLIGTIIGITGISPSSNTSPEELSGRISTVLNSTVIGLIACFVLVVLGRILIRLGKRSEGASLSQ